MMAVIIWLSWYEFGLLTHVFSKVYLTVAFSGVLMKYLRTFVLINVHQVVNLTDSAK